MRAHFVLPLLRTLAIATLILALARPQSGGAYHDTREGIAIQMVLDVSGSMSADDFREVDQPEIGRTPMAAAPFKMSETPLRITPAPTLSQHTHDVLSEFGYDAEDARILRERGIT